MFLYDIFIIITDSTTLGRSWPVVVVSILSYLSPLFSSFLSLLVWYLLLPCRSTNRFPQVSALLLAWLDLFHPSLPHINFISVSLPLSRSDFFFKNCYKSFIRLSEYPCFRTVYEAGLDQGHIKFALSFPWYCSSPNKICFWSLLLYR